MPPNAPPGGSTLIAFPSRDFVSTLNYPAGTYTVNVIRNGVTIGTSAPAVPDRTGAININHPGGSCWIGQTPNMEPGDLVRITDQNGFSNQTTIANVTTDKPVIVKPASPGSTKADGILQVHGTAQTLPGVTPAGPLPVSAIESRIIANKDLFQLNGRRTLRAGGAGKDGTLSYDPVDPVNNPQGIKWTATYKLSEVDLARAVGGGPVFDPATGTNVTFVGSEPRGLWLGTNPLALTENTIYEVPGGPTGIAKGPTTGCAAAAPAQTGPTLVMSPAGGAFAQAQQVTLSASDPAAQIFYTVDGTTPTTASTLYTAPIAISATTTVKAIASNPQTAAISTVASATYTIDSIAPTASITLSGARGSGSYYRGAVSVTMAATDSGGATLATLQYQLDGAPPATIANGNTILVSGDGAHSVTAIATDAAGNTFSTSQTFAIDSVAPSANFTVTGVSGGSPGVYRGATTVQVSATDNAQGSGIAAVTYVLDGAAAASVPSTNTLTIDAAGQHTLTVQATDQAGNTSTPSTQNLTVLAGPCASAALAFGSQSPQIVGATVGLTATATGCLNPEYRFWQLSPTGTWTLLRDWSPVSTSTWNTAGLSIGAYTLRTSVRTGGATAGEAFTDVPFTLAASPACSSATLTPGAASPQVVGASVPLTASATGCASAEYRFWQQAPGGAWTILRDWSPVPTYTWNTAGLPTGGYTLRVSTRAAGASAGQAFTDVPFTLSPSPACSSATLALGATSPQVVGASVLLTGGAAGCSTAEYRFWQQAPGGAWTILRDWSPVSTYTWNTAGLPTGGYTLRLSTRAAGASSGQAFTDVPFTVQAQQPCTSAALALGAASPQVVGTSVPLTGTAVGCSTAEYRYWVQSPSGVWTLARDWSSTATYTWNTAGLPAGAYTLRLSVRAVGSASGQAFTDVAYSLIN